MKRKKVENPLARFYKAASTILETGELIVDGERFTIRSMDFDEENKTYECALTRNKRMQVRYGHVGTATSELDAVSLALEHLESMGYSGMSYETD